MITSFLVSIVAGFIAVDAVVVKEKRQTAVVPPTTQAAIYAQNYRGFKVGGTCKTAWVYACSDTDNAVIKCVKNVWTVDDKGDCYSKTNFVCGYPAFNSGLYNPYCVLGCKSPNKFSGYITGNNPAAICSTNSNQDYCYETRKWVNFSNDTSNCGGCGKTVASLTPGGDTCCSGIARNIQNDVDNCGACGKPAVLDNSAANACCNGKGVDIKNNMDHCGACNRPATSDRPNANKCCGGTGKDLMNDPDNCGECDKKITALLADADTCCSGKATNLKKDTENCGSCGNKVAPKGDTCCNGNIINTKENSSHCGGCDQKCTSGGSPGCCGGRCKDLSVNSKNCGKCDVYCGEEQYCLSSVCHTPESCKEFKDGNVCANSVDKDTNVFSSRSEL